MPPSPTTTVPRWKTAIENAISKYKDQTVVQIATLDTNHKPPTPTPRVRSHIMREFLSAPNAPSLPLLLSSTDVRTPKVTQLGVSPRAELVWWIDGVKQQFRIIGDVWIVPAVNNSEEKKTGEIHERFMRAVWGAGEGTGLGAFRDWILENNGPGEVEVEKEWERRRVAMFGTMSAHMKAGWCRPTPGVPLEEVGGPEAAKKWPERVVEPDPENKDGLPAEEWEERKRNWKMALGNFALVVIEPVEVDFVDLGVVPNRRWLFTKRSAGDGWVWDEEELVP